MKPDISLFDIIGPVMIGPSSSHTAGAARIGFEAYKALGEEPISVVIHLYNSFANTGKGHKTDIALLAGCIGVQPHDANLVRAVTIANQRGIKYQIFWHTNINSSMHPNTAKVELIGRTSHINLTGNSIGGGQIRIVEINGKKAPATAGNTSRHYPTFLELKEHTRTAENYMHHLEKLETEVTGNPVPDQREAFSQYWDIMKDGMEAGLEHKRRARNKMFGGDGHEVFDGPSRLGSDLQHKAMAYAIALSEYNAYMGKIVAAPTAGSSGIIPGVYYSLFKHITISKNRLIDGLYVAASIGAICASKFELAGAVAGCQAEIGVAGSMAAAGSVYILGGTLRQIESAASLVLANLLGLSCDPVRGRVEVPCILRNGIVASMAISSAEMAIDEVEYPIPFDEVVDAAAETGKLLPPCLRETSLCGLATTPTAQKVDRFCKKSGDMFC